MIDETRELAALVERVEAATGADREIDEAILLALGYKPYSFYDENDYSEHGWHAPEGGLPISSVPRYTASLDAAMTLVPEGWRWEVTTTGFKPGASVVGFKQPGQHHGSYAATPALALCAAALRARALSGTGESR